MLKIALTALALLTLSTNANAFTAKCQEGQTPTTQFVQLLRNFPNVQIFGYEGDSADAAREYIEMVIQKKAKPFDQIIFVVQKDNPSVAMSLGLNGCVYQSLSIDIDTWISIQRWIDGI